HDGNGTIDDQLFFEPVYQSGTYSGDPVPDQGALLIDSWQDWDAVAGGWWSLNAATFGPPLVTLASYLASHPGARLAAPPSGAGSIRIVTGFGAGAWDGFEGNVDAFTVNGTTYNFEANPTSMNSCKNNGFAAFTSPRTFKNQGDCVKFTTTGK
ncbi:MAG TPA: hypothetical protein VEA19_01215, partial [Actinomycetota bacterium]|nr:hypothetical protein [Actinomycetota bacterium]